MDVLNNNSKGLRAIILFIACLVCIIVVFHSLIFSGFNILLGDRFDALIETNLLQHWFNVMRGKSEWNTVGYFYPFKNTLGYNDGYFLYGLIYSFFRMLGFDLFISTDLVNISLKVIGFYSFYYLSSRVLNFGFVSSLVGAAIFTLGNSMVVQMLHAQLLSIAFAPLLTIYIIRYFESLQSGESKRTVNYGILASSFLALWLFTSYYMAWYYILYFFVCFTIFVLFFRRGFKDFSKINFSFKTLLLPALFLLIFLMPFLMVYLPKASETGGQSLFATESYAPVLYNVIDPGRHNFLYGRMANYILDGINGLDRAGEFSIGFAPLSISVLLMSTCFLFFKKIKSNVDLLMIAICLTTIITAFFAIKFGEIFLWKYIWHYFPGAKGMRVTSRYFLFLIFPVVLVSTWFLDRLAGKKIGVMFYVFCILLILEQVNFAPNALFDRNKNKYFINSVPVPPQSCKAFYVVGQRKDEFPVESNNITFSYYPHNVDAMLISEVYNLRTINGFSTFNPPGWDFALYPLSTYMARVQNYISTNNISDGMCEFDLENLKWNEFNAGQPIGISSRVYNKIDMRIEGVENHQVSVSFINKSGFNLGKDSYRPLKLGVKLYGADGKLKNQGYMHIDLPNLPSSGNKTSMDFILPDDIKSGEYISISLLEEGVAWFDWFGFKPEIVKF